MYIYVVYILHLVGKKVGAIDKKSSKMALNCDFFILLVWHLVTKGSKVSSFRKSAESWIVGNRKWLDGSSGDRHGEREREWQIIWNTAVALQAYHLSPFHTWSPKQYEDRKFQFPESPLTVGQFQIENGSYWKLICDRSCWSSFRIPHIEDFQMFHILNGRMDSGDTESE